MQQTNDQLWKKCLEIFADNVTAEQYKVWFEPISQIDYSDNRLTLLVPSQYFYEKLEHQFIELLSSTLHRVYGKQVKLVYKYYQVGREPSTAVSLTSSRPSPAAMPRHGVSSNPFAREEVADIDAQLNPSYNFENYCDSVSNRVARTIGEAIANDPKQKTFNPLFIFGAPGVGKTHLIQAIGIRIKEVAPQNRVLYITARLFESQFTSASLKGKVNEFINFYQSIDTLIIDDIQDFIGKTATQGAFFHIFNHLVHNNKQLVLASDCAPGNMEGMEKRLVSRFNMGVVAELEQPDYALRLDVLHQKSEQDGVELPEEVVEFIAQNVTGSIRELEGMVLSILVHASALGREINIDLARKVLSHSVKVSKRTVNFDTITQKVAGYYDIDPDLIFSKSRKREISDARQMVMYMAKKHAKMPLKTIGTRLARTHATVIYACNNIEQRLPIEKQLQNDIAAIESQLLG
ncbi:MAG: chromosomal replication initiator protein DnaA [Paramuribaculum sp.]|nr:chromosomal replication initiator protein DnaA [Paramuribaculum sp.]